MLLKDETLKVGDKVKVVAHGKQGDFVLGVIDTFMDGGSVVVKLIRKRGGRGRGVLVELERDAILGKAE